MTPDFDPYDRMMSFLANTGLPEIQRIVANPAELEALLNRPYLESEEVEPDTPEAAELAEADFERDDRAEERIYELLREAPETWEALKETARRLFPESESDLPEVLDRYSLERLWGGWQSTPTDFRDSANGE